MQYNGKAVTNQLARAYHISPCTIQPWKNVSNVTMSMSNALDSSGLLSSAVQSKKEKPKFEKFGQIMGTVQVEQLDTFLFGNDYNNTITNKAAAPTTTPQSPSAQSKPQQRFVAVKINTQRVEPKIFNGDSTTIDILVNIIIVTSSIGDCYGKLYKIARI
jgi:hypothetical protein